MNALRLIGLASVVLSATGCFEQPNYEPYYASEGAVTITGLDVTSEVGIAGGNRVVIQGSGFGSDPAATTVLIANHNAEILSVSDTEIEVLTPVGPITGGPANVLVANPNGVYEWGPNKPFGDETANEEGYLYDLAPLYGDEPGSQAIWEGQDSYIFIQNMWRSCAGGLSPDTIPGVGCETIAFTGQTGLDGTAEFFDFSYPRVQFPSLGFVSGGDASSEWQVYTPFQISFPSGIDDLRYRVHDFEDPADDDKPSLGFTLLNQSAEGGVSCIDVTQDPPVAGPCNADTYERESSTLEFCEAYDVESGPAFEYRADWPVPENFFRDANGEDTAGASVRLEWSDEEVAGLSNIDLVFPGVAVPELSRGGSQDSWALDGFDRCQDANGDKEATLDEAGVDFRWLPVQNPEAIGGVCEDNDCTITARTYVHLSVSRLNMGWFGGEGAGIRASIVVPDNNEVDADGYSHLSIPNHVLYQFPSPNSQWTTEPSPLIDNGSLGTFESDASYLLSEFYRITDYRIEREDGSVLVLSYATGDLGGLIGAGGLWSNPAEAANACGDCLDGDGDGWVDELDPDCNADYSDDTTVESNATTSLTCNDGVDNDNDGLIDAEDSDCVNGWSGETNCGNGIDDDGDGWVDGQDGECDPSDPFAVEAGADDPTWTCTDGIDNDGDGWTDSEDPGCTTGADLEVDGFDTSLPCNDNIDNDEDGLADASDPFCGANGATADSESPELKTFCIDGDDNDDDGFVDALDPDCEYTPYSRENRDFHDPTDETAPWFGYVAQCYDGLDNDGDGAIDAQDASCWNPAAGFLPDGWLNDEGATQLDPDLGTVTGCTDGLDNDGDGWFDGLDPDCQPGQADQSESGGFNNAFACNDGVDNNNDGEIDAADADCDKGSDNFEGPPS